MAPGALIYLIIIGILDCWIGIILYIVAMVKKSNKLFVTGLILQMFFNFSNLAGSGTRVDAISSIVFFLIFSVIAFLVVNREK